MILMTFCSIGLVFLPPAAELVSIAMLVMAIRFRRVLSLKQKLFVWIIWVIGLVPIVYMVCWGKRVFEWVLD